MRTTRLSRTWAAGVAVLALGLAGCAAPRDDSAGGSAATGTQQQAHVAATSFAEIDPALVEAAKKESGPFLWYDSTPDDQAAKVLADFKKDHPFVQDAKHVMLRAGDVGARVAQETQAGSRTADAVTVDAATLHELEQRKFLESVDWAKNGVPKELVAGRHMTVSGTVIYVLLHNKTKVPAGEAPKTWDDLVDPKWKGQIGTWERPDAITELVPAWGGEKVQRYHAKFKANAPVKYQGTGAIAQAVGAGENKVGLGLYHTSQPAIDKGAPIGLTIPDPAAVTFMYSAVPTGGGRPKTGELFSSWLATKNGAKSYDAKTLRGNALLPETESANLIKGRQLSDFAADRSEDFAEWLAKLSR